METTIKCPTCGKALTMDPAGTFLWNCSGCKYAWSNSEIIAYWKGYKAGASMVLKSIGESRK